MIFAKKTNAPRVSCVRGRNDRNTEDSWLISVRYYGSSGQKGIDRKTYGYATEREAVSDSAHYRHYLESSGRSQKAKWNRSIERTDEALPIYSSVNCSNSIRVLSSPESKAFNKHARFNKLENEFSQSPILREKYKHLFTGNYYTEREARHMKMSLAINARMFRRKFSGTGKHKRA